MRTVKIILLAALLNGFNLGVPAQERSGAGKKNIYHDGWIDLNKNGRKDIYEDQKADISSRVEDLLSQMSLEEKTCQTATLRSEERRVGKECRCRWWTYH